MGCREIVPSLKIGLVNVDSMKRRHGQGSNGWGGGRIPTYLVKIYKLVDSGLEGVRGSRPPRNVRDDFSDRLNPGTFVRVGVGVSWVWPLRGGRKSWEWEESPS